MEQAEIRIRTAFIKLDQLLKFSGITQTGGMSKEMIADGKIQVNGEVCTQRGKKIHVNDQITIDSKQILTVLAEE